MADKYLYTSPDGAFRLLIESDGKALTALRFCNEVSQYSTQHNLQIFSDTCKWLDIYFSGRQPDFLPALNLQGTAFQKKIWNTLLTIPYGQTISYGEIAKRVKCNSAQAVGRAVGSNPILIIIPCHRVIGKNGSLIGYSAGIERKLMLLHAEGIEGIE